MTGIIHILTKQMTNYDYADKITPGLPMTNNQCQKLVSQVKKRGQHRSSIVLRDNLCWDILQCATNSEKKPIMLLYM